MHRPLLILLFLLLAAGPTGAKASSDGIALLFEPLEQTLRDQTIDLDDDWSAARLLAHFGEGDLAYRRLRERPRGGPLDMQMERLEARLLAQLGRPAHADSLLALQTTTPDLETYYLLCLQRARLNLEAGRPERSLAFITLIDSLPQSEFAPYADYVAITALLEAKRYGEACRRGERGMERGIPQSLSPDFEARLLDAYFASQEWTRARRFIDLLKRRTERARAFAPLLAREVDLWFELGDTTRAIDTGLDVVKNRRMRGQAASAIDSVIEKAPLHYLSSEALLEFMDSLLDRRRLVKADRAVALLDRRTLDPVQSERLRLFKARLAYEERRYSRAFEWVRLEFSDKTNQRDAALLRARIYRKTGQSIHAADAYSAFAGAYPYDPVSPEALFVAADLYLRANDRDRGMSTLDLIVDTYPTHRYARLSALKMASYYLERRHLSRGVSILERALERSRRQNAQFLHYLAKAYGEMGRDARREKLLEELRELNPISFYLAPDIARGYRQPIMGSNGTIELAGDRGLMTFLTNVFERRESAFESIRPLLDPLPDRSQALEAGAVYLSRGRHFLLMGFRDWAEAEFSQLESRQLTPRMWFELGVLYDDFSMHWKSVRAFQRVYYSLDRETRRAHDADFKHLMYPVPYPSLVFENCGRNAIAPHLVYAMMREESLFNFSAVSRAGAVGLMQLMPSTGEEVASRLGFPESLRSNLFAPDVNLTFGIWYASHLLRRADGNPLMMLAAYNAGFGNAKRWFSSAQGSGFDDTVSVVDGVTYRETRAYIKRIVESSHVYHRYYFAPERVGDSGSP